MIKFSGPILTFIERQKYWQIFSYAILSIVIFAFFYLRLSNHSKGNGLIIPVDSESHLQVTFFDALYFSVVTESTLGYGDIRPIGISRFLACSQVLCGLVFAGLLVAKITSLRDGKLRYAISHAEGFWFEFLRFPGEKAMLAFVHIYSDGDNLHYDGDNFDENGVHLESFTGSLVTTDKNVLAFYYKNQKNYFFDNGITELNFYNASISDVWTNYDAVSIDHGKVEKVEYWGYRASKEQIKTMKSQNRIEMTKLIKSSISNYKLIHK